MAALGNVRGIQPESRCAVGRKYILDFEDFV